MKEIHIYFSVAATQYIIPMDLKLMGKTWAENISQKYEAMYQEVDDFMSQGTVKYMDNQVQSMGKNVRKLCSSFVQDLLPPYVDVKHKAQAVPLPMNGLEEKPVDINDTKRAYGEWDPFDITDPYAFTDSVKQLISRLDGDIIRETNIKENDKDAEIKEEQHISEDQEENNHNLLLDKNPSYTLDASEGIRFSQGEHCNDSFNMGPLADARVDDADARVKCIDISDNVKVDDSCVIVDSESLCAISNRARKLNSYKKLIQDAFTSRNRLRKEYKQLAICYGDIDLEFTQHPKGNTVPTPSLMPSVSKKLTPLDSCDSERELL